MSGSFPTWDTLRALEAERDRLRTTLNRWKERARDQDRWIMDATARLAAIEAYAEQSLGLCREVEVCPGADHGSCVEFRAILRGDAQDRNRPAECSCAGPDPSGWHEMSCATVQTPCRWDGFGLCLEHNAVYDDEVPGGGQCLAVSRGEGTGDDRG
jgi:hypothetical protein